MADNNYLPIDFIKRMESDLGSDFRAFLRSYDEEKISALRFNPIKADETTIKNMAYMLGDKVDWSPNGYYYDDEKVKPGTHPYHAAGLYYIQDASAQLPVEMLSPKPGDIVLDLCASPGGKSTQIAGYLKGKGVLVSNEPIKNRAKILSENIERLGIRNCIVTSEYPNKLADKYKGYFDKIMVDAPCSGEGMFRKNHEACREWSLENVEMCSVRQAEILDSAYSMLSCGGKMCYSTCTFSKLENEDTVAAFIDRHPDMTVIAEHRLWPHEIKGEGHYACLLEKSGSFNGERNHFNYKKIDTHALSTYYSFIDDLLKDTSEWGENLFLKDDLLYKLPDDMPDISGIHVLRGGLFLGTLKKNRFEPGHTFALALSKDEIKKSIDFKSDSDEIFKYLQGQSIQAENTLDGWILITVDGYSIGWGKVSNGQIKNHYPKGLRRI